jgi:hypothetical protein
MIVQALYTEHEQGEYGIYILLVAFSLHTFYKNITFFVIMCSDASDVTITVVYSSNILSGKKSGLSVLHRQLDLWHSPW